MNDYVSGQAEARRRPREENPNDFIREIDDSKTPGDEYRPKKRPAKAKPVYEDDMDFEDEAGPQEEESPASININAAYFTKILWIKLRNFIVKILDSFGSFFYIAKEDEAQIFFDQGKAFQKKGSLDQAINSFKKTIKNQPSNHEAFRRLGECYLKTKKYLEAKDIFKSVIKMNGTDPLNYFWLGKIHFHLGENKDAVEYYQKAAEIAPDVSEFSYRLAIAYDSQGMGKEAIGAFNRAITIDPENGKYYYRLGFSYDSQGDHQKAVECFKKALALEEG
ncbi:MAG: tetratricopeptide repeat protein [Elusimicrobia bacterium]|nr:tetratricopeptide repeat protein [Candidatus Liberimonas magnetica]